MQARGCREHEQNTERGEADEHRAINQYGGAEQRAPPVPGPRGRTELQKTKHGDDHAQRDHAIFPQQLRGSHNPGTSRRKRPTEIRPELFEFRNDEDRAEERDDDRRNEHGSGLQVSGQTGCSVHEVGGRIALPRSVCNLLAKRDASGVPSNSKRRLDQ